MASPEFNEVECFVNGVFSVWTCGHGEEFVFADSFASGWSVEAPFFLPVDDLDTSLWIEVRKTRVEEIRRLVKFMEHGDDKDAICSLGVEVASLLEDEVGSVAGSFA